MNRDKTRISGLTLFRDLINTFSFAMILIIFELYISEILQFENDTRTHTLWAYVFIFAICYGDLFIKKYCNNFILYKVLHLSFVAGILLPMKNGEKVICMVYVAVLYYIGEGFWKSETKSRTKASIVIPAEVFVIIVPVYLHVHYFLSAYTDKAILICATVYLVMNFINMFLDKFITRVLSVPEGGSIAIEKIMFANMKLLSFVFAFAIVLIITANSLIKSDSSLRRILTQSGKAFGNMAVGCVSLCKQGVYEDKTEDAITTTEAQTFDLTKDTVEQLKENDLAVLISDIIMIVVSIAFVIFGLYLLIMYYKQYMRKAYSSEEIVTKKDKDVVAKLKKTKKARSFSIFRPKNNNERARYLFKKKVMSYKGTFIDVVPSDTPTDISEKIYRKSGEDIGTMKELYEKARYSDKMLTNEEVKQMSGKVK